MTAKLMNFEMRRGDALTVEGELRDENRALVNDPTSQWKLAARATRSATAPVVFTVGPLAQFAAGIGRCPIPASATSGFTYDRKLFYDMQVQETGGNVTTVLVGTITVYVDMAQ